ncbi:acyl-CoA N-acyltransferase [Macroventuria anomochaeta]|uniref:Acyl-CoA N-acyltransferase n=1 Tax=Macroventuria anomochaeta TaxID=301207 RepID=A0ACB6RHV7_9PLEO|nr:acyl-CoA N-acyltransferase [Macroventuria anomochaeta]KAF2621561.1 acyl-CoA N-acyltransferase [Macroventuria anomochaeta]
MATHFKISEARPADAEAIASLFALSWVSPFTRLQFGQTEPAQLAASMVPRIKEQMVTANSKFIVERHPETDKVAAVAQWTVPAEEEVSDVNKEPEEDRDERQQFEDEAYRRSLPDNSNKDLIMAFTLGLRQLREETLQGRKHFLLENLATHPDYRGKGLASQLVEWACSLADEQQVLLYLDTASDNPAARLYKKLGFEERGRNTIEDLGRYAPIEIIEWLGCDPKHTHIAFLRFPKAHLSADQ